MHRQRVLEPISNGSLNVVADLIDPQKREWKSKLIRDTFSEMMTNNILPIPLAMVLYEDFRVWRGEATGEFTVCSAYRILQ